MTKFKFVSCALFCCCFGPELALNTAPSDWSTWGQWTQCIAPCGQSGTMVRKRSCGRQGITAANCKAPCVGKRTETRTCLNTQCCDDAVANWSQWQQWTSCSAPCGTPGVIERKRTCGKRRDIDPYCKDPCDGKRTETKPCLNTECCVNGGWATWSSWTSCLIECGQGVRERTRTCSRPRPTFCGQDCEGSRFDTVPCESGVECCKRHNWSTWASWSSCSETCGYAVRSRSRSCKVIQEGNYCKHESEFCVGEDNQKEECTGTQPCDHINWGPWGACSVTCAGTGTKERTSLARPEDSGIVRRQVETAVCNVEYPPCYSQFGNS